MALQPRVETEKNIPGWLSVLLLIGVVLVAYSRVWQFGFVWDDEAHLTENLVVVGSLGVKQAWTSADAVYYPLVTTTFWALHKLVGLNPMPYHMLNVVIHALNALLLWRLLRALDVRGAWVGAALWALHPVMVQSVAWVTELKNTQSCLFYLLSIFFFLKADLRESGDRGRWQFLGLALLLFILAVASKSSTVMLPIALILCLWWRGHSWRWRDFIVLAPFFLISAFASAWTVWEQKVHSGAIGSDWGQTWPERLIIAGRAVWFYLGKLIWPHPLIFMYPRWSIDASSPIAYLPLVVAVISLTFLWLKRGTVLRPIFFAASYFVILLFPVLGFFNVYFFRYSFVSDHFQYLASMGPLALAAATVAHQLSILEWAPGLRVATYGAVLFVPGLLTWRQTASYNDVVALYSDVIAKNPTSWLAHYNLAIALRAKGKIDEAIAHYRQGLALRPDHPEAHYNLGRLLVEKGEFGEAIAEYEKALTGNPDDAEAHNNLGATLFQTGRVEEAISQYRKALAVQPDHADASSNLAHALFRQGQTEEAVLYYERAIRLQPDDAGLRVDLGNALVLSGRIRDALSQYQRALTLAPGNVTAQSNLAWLLATSSDPSLRDGTEALHLAESANRSSGGNDPIILRILAAAYAESGDFTSATQVARRALQVAGSTTNGTLVAALEKEIALYESGAAYHRARR